MQETSENQNKKIDPFIDDFDIEDFDFKPINKGLGFHHSEREKITTVKNGVTLSPVASSSTTIKDRTISAPLPRSGGGSTLSSIGKNTPPELEAFYGKSTSRVKGVVEDVSSIKKTEKSGVLYKNASVLEKLMAWFVDVVILLFIQSVLIGIFAVVVNVEPVDLFKLFGVKEYSIFGIMFGLLYISYFSVLDLAQSPGKSFFKIQLVGNDSKLTYKSSFFRAIISLISLSLLGLPALLDFSGKLSDTRVVKSV